jgi:hypothetical protein
MSISMRYAEKTQNNASEVTQKIECTHNLMSVTHKVTFWLWVYKYIIICPQFWANHLQTWVSWVSVIFLEAMSRPGHNVGQHSRDLPNSLPNQKNSMYT